MILDVNYGQNESKCVLFFFQLLLKQTKQIQSSKMHQHQPQRIPNTADKPQSKQDQELDDLWKQVRQIQNQTATAAREYQDIRSTQKQLRGPTETAAERYQHKQVQKDFDHMRDAAVRITKDTDRIIFKESEAVVASLEMGVNHLANEKQRLEARLAELNGQIAGMQGDFEKELEKMDQKRREMKKVQV